MLSGRRYGAADAVAAGIAHAEAGEGDVVAATAGPLAPFTGKDRDLSRAITRDLYAGAVTLLEG